MRIISLIKAAPGIPTQYDKKTDTKDAKGINTRKKRMAISKREILEIWENHEANDREWVIENRKKSCES